MKELKLKWVWILLLVFGVVMFAEPMLGRGGRGRTGRSAPRSSGTRRTSVARARPSRPVSSSNRSRQTVRPSFGMRAQPSRSFRPTPRASRLRSEPTTFRVRSRRIVTNRIPRSSQPSIRIRRPEIQRPNTRIAPSREPRRSISRSSTPVIRRPDPSSFRHRNTGLDSQRDRRHRQPEYRRLHYPRYRADYPSRRIFHRIVLPSYRRTIYYDYGPYWSLGYVWPYHHRRYIFVSLGGWWPSYSYRRYYWYGCHAYRWYGYDPIEYVIPDNTYNYYTYNYYYPGEVVGGVQAPDYDALSKVREKLKKLKEKPAKEPAEETRIDRYFKEAVKAFEIGDYTIAIAKFHDALESAPDDIVLPFAYIQALFANEEYEKAVGVLREALSKAEPQKEGVFYPRGLYLDDDILKKQIEKLVEAVNLNPHDANLQLLLGYQLLGMGRLDEAAKFLEKAQQNDNNCQAATLLINLLEKLRNAEENKVD